MNRISKLCAFGVIGVAVVFGGWACTDDKGNELSLEEYFQELDEMENNFSEKGDATFEDLPEEPEVADVEDALGSFTGVLEDFVDELEGLNPPEEAQEAHDAVVEAGRAASDEYNALVDSISDFESVDDIFTSAAGESVTEALDGFTEACKPLQQLADDNDIDVDLNCEDSE